MNTVKYVARAVTTPRYSRGTPSADAVKGSELGLIASFGVAQWAEAELKCVLKGGNPPPEQPETRIAIQGYIAAEGVAGA